MTTSSPLYLRPPPRPALPPPRNQPNWPSVPTKGQDRRSCQQEPPSKWSGIGQVREASCPGTGPNLPTDSAGTSMTGPLGPVGLALEGGRGGRGEIRKRAGTIHLDVAVAAQSDDGDQRWRGRSASLSLWLMQQWREHQDRQSAGLEPVGHVGTACSLPGSKRAGAGGKEPNAA